MTPKQSACAELLSKFPTAATLTLARMAHKQNPTMFTGVEDARSSIRYLRGANGSKDRKHCSVKGFERSARQPGDPFAALPDGVAHFNDWETVNIGGPCRVLQLSDIHIPYHEKAPLLAALKYGRDRKPDIVFLNGDALDFFACSFWEKDPRQRDLGGEIKTGREFLSTLRAAFPKARILFKEGNHEERWTRYLSVKAPELLGIEDFELPTVMHFAKHGIEHIGERRPVRFGKLNTIHGHEYRFNISNPVNPARGFFLRAKVHVIGSHLHQTSQHSEKNLDGNVVSTWSTGCLCNLHPDYSPLNNWNHGFAFYEIDKAGAFNVDNLKIIDGRVY